jgi:hypothetical protein
MKRKQLPEILYKVTCQSNIENLDDDTPFDQRLISSILANQYLSQHQNIYEKQSIE